jgi:Tol biopolymer transport system component
MTGLIAKVSAAMLSLLLLLVSSANAVGAALPSALPPLPHVVFVTWDAARTAQTTTRLMLTDIDGSPPRELLGGETAFAAITPHPNGRMIAYVAPHRPAGHDAVFLLDVARGKRLWLHTCAPTCPTLAWAAAGDRLALLDARTPASSSVRILDFETHTRASYPIRRLPYGTALLWSGEDDRLLFTAYPDDPKDPVEVYALDPASGQVGVVREPLAGARSPDGQRVARALDFAGDAAVVISGTGGDMTHILSDSGRIYSSPIWEPDGQHVTVADQAVGNTATRYTVLTRLSLDQQTRQRLTSGNEFGETPIAWSRDGAYLLFYRFTLRAVGTRGDVWVYDARQGAERSLLSGVRPIYGDVFLIEPGG